MKCFCCGRDVSVGRKAKVRRPTPYDPDRGGPESAAYQSYQEQATYRWAVVCPACYLQLDSFDGTATIDGQFFTMAGESRRDKAVTLTEKTYRAWQRREAAKLGLDPDPDPTPGGA